MGSQPYRGERTRRESDGRIDEHLETALEESDDEDVNYHIREALGLLRL